MSDIKLHLGCGERFLKGCIHVDFCEFDHIDHKHDIRTLPMFEDDSVELIYASHSLEYFNRAEALDVLAEWKRVLKPGGTIRLAVPDFEALIQVYQQSHNIDNILGPIFGQWSPNKNDTSIYHKTVYDYNSLKAVLETAGFSNVTKWDWHQVFVDDWEGYDDFSQAYFPHMDKENGLLISLNVEATK